MKHLIVAGFMVLVAPVCGAQAESASTPVWSSTNTGYVPTMTFDVASVRENKDIDVHRGMVVSGQFVPHTAIFRANNWDIQNLIGFAYGVDRSQMVGLPKWPFPTFFVIEAKGDREADAKMSALSSEQQTAEQEHMLQKLLEDRFKLTTHWETRDSDIYKLVTGKGGPKLGAEGSIPPSADELKDFGDHPIPTIHQVNDGRGYDFIAHGCSMSELVRILTGTFGKPVNDETGLTGKYDFVLKYRGRWDRDRDADDMDPTPPMDRALQEELGLKLETAKGPVKMLIIDHIEKPSPN
jgi:uncharacterized protein (TIGR03435 family)